MLVLMNTQNLVLRPNCLLTLSPLVFISGPRSLFFYRPFAEDLKNYIAAHGYSITPMILPFRAPQSRKNALQDWFSRQNQAAFHFVMAQETWTEFETELQSFLQKSPRSTVTLISSEEPRNNSPQLTYFKVNPCKKLAVPFSYRLHQFFCFLEQVKSTNYEHTLLVENRPLSDRFLDHCIKLAENEINYA